MLSFVYSTELFYCMLKCGVILSRVIALHLLLIQMLVFVSFPEHPEKQEQLHAIYKVLEQLPTACFNTLERLFFHLVKYILFMAGAILQCVLLYKYLTFFPFHMSNIFLSSRVSKDESHNRMSPNSLAIVFAPCILRCPDSADPLMSMKDVAKTTT